MYEPQEQLPRLKKALSDEAQAAREALETLERRMKEGRVSAEETSIMREAHIDYKMRLEWREFAMKQLDAYGAKAFEIVESIYLSNLD